MKNDLFLLLKISAWQLAIQNEQGRNQIGWDLVFSCHALATDELAFSQGHCSGLIHGSHHIEDSHLGLWVGPQHPIRVEAFPLTSTLPLLHHHPTWELSGLPGTSQLPDSGRLNVSPATNSSRLPPALQHPSPVSPSSTLKKFQSTSSAPATCFKEI